MYRAVVAGLLSCLTPGMAFAGIMTYNDQASFAAAAPDAIRYVVSGPAADYSPSYTLGPATFTSQSAMVFDDGSFGSGVQYAEFFPSQVIITLARPAYAIGLTLGTFSGTDTLDVSLNAVPATTVSSAGPAPATFFLGFTDTDPITSLTLFDRATSRQIDVLDLTVANAAPGGGPVLLPEPASLMMLCFGTLATTTGRRRPVA